MGQAGSALNGDINIPGMAGGNGVRISSPGVTSAVAAGNAWGGGNGSDGVVVVTEYYLGAAA